MPLTRSRERHTVIPAVRSTAVQFLTSVQPIKIIRVLQYQPIKTRVKETEKPDSYRRTTLVDLFQKFEIGEKEGKEEEKKRKKRGRKGKRREKKRGVVKANSTKILECHRKQTEVRSGLRFLPFEEGAGRKRKFLVRNLRSVA